jgi:hypothetical protein
MLGSRLRILGIGNPQRSAEQGAHDQAFRRFGVDRADRAFIDQLLDAALSAADTIPTVRFGSALMSICYCLGLKLG